MPAIVHRRFTLVAVATAMVTLLGACGGSSTPTPSTPPATNLTPTGVAQPVVTPGPLGSGRASATWAAASDDATAESALVYHLHASTQPDFTPDSSTLVFEGTGAHQASVASGLVAGRRYTFKLVVKDAQGLASTGPGASVAMYTATPHSGVTDQQCYEAGSDAWVPCNSPGALALNSQQDGHRTAVTPNQWGRSDRPAHRPDLGAVQCRPELEWQRLHWRSNDHDARSSPGPRARPNRLAPAQREGACQLGRQGLPEPCH